MAIYNDDINIVYKKLKSNKNGISQESVKSRQDEYGKNIIEKQKHSSFIMKLLYQFKNIMIIILFLSAIISCAIAISSNDYESLFEGILIFVIVFINAIVGVIQEQKAENALKALTNASEPYATVMRDSEVKHIKVRDIVVGDVVFLKTGNIVPADIRLIETQNLKCNESSMTGESNSILKNENALFKKNLQISEQTNMCFSGTTIISGKGKGIVTAVGKNTEIGKIAKILNNSIKEKTPLEKEIDKIGKILTIGILLIVFIVFGVQILFHTNQDFLNILLTAVTLAVAAIPESLPAVITIIMAMGVQKLARKNAIIKKLSAVETLGCCNIVCSDKTGTLTKNEMNVVHINQSLKTFSIDDKNLTLSSKLIEIAGVCNNIVFNKDKPNGDATEIAISKALISQNINIDFLKSKFKKISENEFDSSKKQMRIICSNNNTNYLFAKGAIDYLINSCSKILINNEEVDFTELQKTKILLQNEEICQLGERVIAFAYKNNCSNLNDTELVFVGFVGIIDPPRKEAYESIKKCRKAGLETIMITGDHPSTAFAIAKKLGIAKNKNEVLTGNDLNNLSDIELIKRHCKIGFKEVYFVCFYNFVRSTFVV